MALKFFIFYFRSNRNALSDQISLRSPGEYIQLSEIVTEGVIETSSETKHDQRKKFSYEKGKVSLGKLLMINTKFQLFIQTTLVNLQLPTSKSANRDQFTLETTLATSKTTSTNATNTSASSVKTLESIPSFGQLHRSSSNKISHLNNNSSVDEL